MLCLCSLRSGYYLYYVIIIRSIACCAEEDLCNKELAPVYEPTREEEGEGAEFVDPSVYHLALLVSLTVCLVLFILLLTFAYLRYPDRYLHMGP